MNRTLLLHANESSRPVYLIESVDSALRLLHLFLDTDRLRLTEAAAALEVSPSTAHRLLATLCYHGFVSQDRSRHEYRPGPVMLRLGAAAMKRLDIGALAQPIMEGLAEKTNETVGLGILQGANVLYVAGVDGKRVVRVGARTGALIPAHCISKGKVLLATLDDAELDALYPSEELPRLTERSVATKTELRAQLAVIRRRGYGQTSGESEDGVASIAVAVRDGDGATRGAMSVAAPYFRVTKAHVAEWLPLLRHAAAELGSAI